MKRFSEVLFLAVLLFNGCSKEKADFPFSKLSYEGIDQYRNEDYRTSSRRLHFFIDSFRMAERDTDYVDVLTNRYYAGRKPYLWINKWGTDLRCDTVLQWLDDIEKAGLPPGRFYLARIHRSLDILRRLDFDDRQTASYTLASLEYYLTKSYMRYTRGQRFGFVNPNKMYNNVDKVEKDSANSPYRTLFDIPIETFGKSFFATALQSVREYRVNSFLTSVQPASPLYKRIYEEMQREPARSGRHKTLSVNLERSRWRMKDSEEKKYVTVNLPSQRLTAQDGGGNSLDMKICLGSFEHKTPMLTSRIAWLELNPYWIIPQSIVKRDVVRHVGDTAYFSRKRFKIMERATGDFVSPLNVTRDMLLSGQYRVRQDKGEDNSLGRMIFRFPNAYSIYLHDTNEKDVFNRSYRAVSHGCIRLEKPYDLAMFFLGDKDEVYIDRIRVALDMEPLTDEGREKVEDFKNKPMKRCVFKPLIPLFIVYYTSFPDATGKMAYYPDIYKYDELLWAHLKTK